MISRFSIARAAKWERGEMGALCVRLPLPPGCLPTLWNADQRFIDSYLSEFPGLLQDGRRRIHG